MIFLVRHAESEANVGIATSSPETIQITEKGRLDSIEFADKIKIAPDLIVTSNHERTRQTAQPLIEKYPESLRDIWAIHEFTYLSPASCINTTKEDRKIRVEDYWSRCDPHYVEGTGAESFSAFFERVQVFFNKMKLMGGLHTYFFSHEQVIKLIMFLSNGEINEPSVEGMRHFRNSLLTNPLENLRAIQFETDRELNKLGFINFEGNHITDKSFLEREINEITEQDSVNKKYVEALKSGLAEVRGFGPLLEKKLVNLRYNVFRNLKIIKGKVPEFDDNILAFYYNLIKLDNSWNSIKRGIFPIRSELDLNEIQNTIFWYKDFLQDYNRLKNAKGIDLYNSNLFTFRNNQIERFESSKNASHYLSKMQIKGLERKDIKYFKITLHMYCYEKYFASNCQIANAESLGVKVMTLYSEHFGDNVKIGDLWWLGKVIRTPYLKKPGLLKLMTDLVLIIGRKDIHGRQLSPLTNYRNRVQNRRGFDRDLFRKKVLIMLLSEIERDTWQGSNI